MTHIGDIGKKKLIGMGIQIYIRFIKTTYTSMANRNNRSHDFQPSFYNLSLEHQEVVRKFLVEADKHGHHLMSSANFEGTCQQLNNVLPVLMMLCPSIRPSSVGVISGDMVQTILISYSPGDLVIPDFILDEVVSPMSEEQDEESDGGGLLQRSMSSSATPRAQQQFESDDCPSSCR